MSLQSRLEILCDEADRDSESIIDEDQEAGRHLSMGKQIPQLDLQLQRYMTVSKCCLFNIGGKYESAQTVLHYLSWIQLVLSASMKGKGCLIMFFSWHLFDCY